jgi:hypothetical protein
VGAPKLLRNSRARGCVTRALCATAGFTPTFARTSRTQNPLGPGGAPTPLIRAGVLCAFGPAQFGYRLSAHKAAVESSGPTPCLAYNLGWGPLPLNRRLRATAGLCTVSLRKNIRSIIREHAQAKSRMHNARVISRALSSEGDPRIVSRIKDADMCVMHLQGALHSRIWAESGTIC